MSIAFYQHLAQVLEQKLPVVVATVTHIKGSVPREVGAKMIVCADGQTMGTIGGGAGEAKVIDYALAVLLTGENQWVEIDLSGAPHRETQGICGGIMRVWLERWSGEDAIDLTRQILALLQSGQSATLVIPFDAQTPSFLLNPSLPIPSDAFVETLQPPPTLLIVGAGHVGEQLAKVAHLIGFQIAIQDDRIDWANPHRYPQACQIFAEPIAASIPQLATHTQLYAALVTRGYQYDLEALKWLLNREISCHYIGMIGSEKRVRQVYQAIEQTGISRNKLSLIYAPIGLDIGALTPEEIAVSIAAELILVRRGGTGRSLSEHLRQSF
ncbi:MAG: XdhC family protein [Cyanobacteria bacterium CRU_2_1]|nr:XdhC family protein [Cyanobacteria bacterium RU_5_0]NJR61611.1 XdhC family protein [Cyanobacteria bacterium CRU_2_1]